MTRWIASGRTIYSDDDPAPKVMGIINATPDSFSDGGRFDRLDAAIAQARRLAAEGADILDIGGESSRPGAEPVPMAEELRRVLPVIEAIASDPGVPISVDTTKAEVARLAIEAGAAIVNDITAMRGDPKMAEVVAGSGAGVVLMHMRGTPQTMMANTHYDDVVGEVFEDLARQLEWAGSVGIPRDRIAIDPGISFGKTTTQNLALLRSIDRFATLGCVVLVGTSRKGFLGKLTGRPLEERATASAVSSLAACVAGARVVRVHDVAASADAIKVWGAIRGWEIPT